MKIGTLLDRSPAQLMAAGIAEAKGSLDETVITSQHPAVSPAIVPSKLQYFGDYEIREEIARGGMGVVYLARQVSLDRLVAVKMILSGCFASDAEVKRFRTEAEAAAKLQHPGIVAIHEIGEHEGRQYFSMDHVAGDHLGKIIKDGPIAVSQAVQMVKCLAEAVHYAHGHGVLHRDLKPQNILVDSSGRPRITDFGLAKLTGNPGELTVTGAVLGTPRYMAPEQAAGRLHEICPATDVYSLGVILFELLTGRAPFEAPTPVQILERVLNEEPGRPSKLNARLSTDLDNICLKCLEKQPARRYASAQKLAEDLGRFLNYEPILARPPGEVRRLWNWTQKNPWRIAAGFALLGLLLVCASYGLWEQSKFLKWRIATGGGFTRIHRGIDRPSFLHHSAMPVPAALL